MYRHLATGLLAGAACAAQAGLSVADEVEEIVVTAQKREETVQRIPLAVTALGGAALQERDATTVASLAPLVPNFKMSEEVGQPRITLRGIGVDNTAAGAESSIAFNQDGVYYSRPSAIFASMYDIARIEVLRGPQGTLYGRNATGGSVNIITNQPTDTLHAAVNVTGGNHETFNSEGFLSGPLGDVLAGRVSYSIQHHAGYGENLITGSDIDNRDSQAVRAQLLAKPTTDLTVLLSADYSHQKDRSNGYHQFAGVGYTPAGQPVTPLGIALGGAPAPDPRDIASPLDPLTKNIFYGGRLEVRYRLSDVVSLESLSAYRYSDTYNITDGNPLTVAPIVAIYAPEKSRQYSQEFQLNADTESNKFVSGLYYLRERDDATHFAPLSLAVLGGPNILAQGVTVGGALNTDAAAIYGQDTYSVTSRLRFTLGARYSWERKGAVRVSEIDFARLFSPDNRPLTPYDVQHETFTAFTPKVGVDFDLAEHTMIYASFSRGFKSGTYGLGDLAPALRPERVTAYEGGIKSTLFDDRLRVNLAGFFYSYKDLQVNRVVNTVTILENAATARIYGMESEIQLKPFDAPFMLYGNASWLHARFLNYTAIDPNRPFGDGVTQFEGVPAFNLAGNALPQSPNVTALLGAQYGIPMLGGVTQLRAEGSWTDRAYFNAFNTTQLSQGSHVIINGFLNWISRDDHWKLMAYLKNATDKRVWTFAETAGPIIGSAAGGFLDPPRTFGLTVGYQY